MKPQFKKFLTSEVFDKLSTLKGDQAPNFGIMTAQHMVEHLVYVTKSMVKRNGEPSGEMNKSQKYFRGFVDKGCPFEHRPKEGAKLADLRSSSIEEAIEALKAANDKFYSIFDTNPDYKSYNEMTGEFSMKDMEIFMYQHSKWHLHQFGLMEFQPLEMG